MHCASHGVNIYHDIIKYSDTNEKRHYMRYHGFSNFGHVNKFTTLLAPTRSCTNVINLIIRLCVLLVWMPMCDEEDWVKCFKMSADNLHSRLQSVGTCDALEKYIMRFVRSRNGKTFCGLHCRRSGPDSEEVGPFTRSDWMKANHGRNDILRSFLRYHIVVWGELSFWSKMGPKSLYQADGDDP